MQKFNFLIVESDDQINFLTSQIIDLDDMPIKAHFEKNPLTALAFLENLGQRQFPDVILVSDSLSFMTGLEFSEAYIQRFYHFNPDTQIYITTNYCSSEMVASILSRPKIAGFILQPFSKKTFLEQIVPNIYVSLV